MSVRKGFAKAMESAEQDALPEERELASKREQLETLEAQLLERELELATLQAELRSFEFEYLRVVGVRLARLDELEALIAEEVTRQRPEDAPAMERAESARSQAADSAAAVGDTQEEQAPGPQFRPTEDLRKTYLQVSKAIHPDLTTDEEEKARRHDFMVAANEAYARGDLDGLKAVLSKWRSDPEAVSGDDVAAELVRTIRKTAQVKARLVRIQEESEALLSSELYELHERGQQFGQGADELLRQMALELDNQIADAQERLDTLRKQEKQA